MDKLKNNRVDFSDGQQNSVTAVSKKSKMTTFFRMLIFMGAISVPGIFSEAHADTTSGKNSYGLMEKLVKENGYSFAGKIPGGAIMCGTGDDPDKAKKQAVHNSEALLGTTDLDHTFTKVLVTDDGKHVICVISKKKTVARPQESSDPPDIEAEKNQKMEQMVKDFGFEYAGRQKDGSVIAFGEGDNKEDAEKKAFETAKLFMPDVSLKTDYKTHALLSNGKYVVGIQASELTMINGVRVLPRSAKLDINTKNTHYMAEKTRADGEDDLLELCKTAEKEEAWIYVIKKDGQETWTENGFNKKNGNASIDMTPMKHITKESGNIAGISFYHHHPVDTKRSHDTSQTPSRIDITGFMNTLELISKKNPELAEKIDFRVATTTDFYVIKISPTIFKNKTYLRRVYKLTKKLGRERMMFPHFNYRRNNADSYHIENIRFAKRFSSPLLDIRFKPSKEALSKKPAQVKIINLHKQFRDTQTSILYRAFYVPQAKKIILKGYQVKTLYNGDGKRIGYVKENGQWTTGEPENGWPEDEIDTLSLNDRAKKEIKRLRKEYKYFR